MSQNPGVQFVLISHSSGRPAALRRCLPGKVGTCAGRRWNQDEAFRCHGALRPSQIGTVSGRRHSVLATGLSIGPCQFLTTGSGHLQMMCCPAALLTFLTSHRSEYRGPGPGAQSCADSSSSPTPCMFSLPPPAWAYLAPLAHTSLPRTDTGKPHPVHIPSGGRRLKEAAHGLNDVRWTSRAEGDDTSPHGHRQASLPCDGKCRPCSGQALV